MAQKKSPGSAQLDRDIAAITNRGGLRDLLRRARRGDEPGADLVAGDAILSAGYSPERANRALSQRPISCKVKQDVAAVESKRIERRDAGRRGAAKRLASHAPAAALRKANDQLYDLTTNRYFASIPLDQIFGIVERAGLHFDPEEKECILTGRSGRSTWKLFNAAGNEVDHLLAMTWHKMDTTGRYEIVAYVS